MLNNLLEAFLLFLPAAIGNVTPILANKIPLLNRWDTPIDFGLKIGGQRVLGPNKRLRGLVLGALTAAVAALLVRQFWPTSLGIYSWSVVKTFWFGVSLGLGALLGDVVESFFKRRADVQPGNSWFPFDQVDYILGGLVASYPFVHWQGRGIAYVMLIYFVVHVAAGYAGYTFGLKDKPI